MTVVRCAGCGRELRVLITRRELGIERLTVEAHVCPTPESDPRS